MEAHPKFRSRAAGVLEELAYRGRCFVFTIYSTLFVDLRHGWVAVICIHGVMTNKGCTWRQFVPLSLQRICFIADVCFVGLYSHFWAQHPTELPYHVMRSMRSTRSTQRQSQRTRQRIATYTERDYYDCPRCRKLFLRYHGSHKRHIRTCTAKHKAQAEKEARSQAERIETPTPDPYTPVPTDTEMEVEDIGTGV